MSISVSLNSHFKPEVVEKLEKNLEALEGVKPGIQLVSYGDERIRLDNRWFGSTIYLDPKDLEWTFENMHLALSAYVELEKISYENELQKKEALEKNFKLRNIAGKVRSSSKFYFARLKVLSETYSNLQKNEKIEEALASIEAKYKPKIREAKKIITLLEHQKLLSKDTIGEIPSDSTLQS